MTRKRWIADKVSGNRAALVGDHARHLAQVLRAQVGQEFEISAVGEVRSGRIVSVQPERVEFELGEAVQQKSSFGIIAVISIFKFDRMEWAIEKCTELGVARIVPMIAARTETHLASASAKRVERWRRIAHQASEQARRISLPEVENPRKLKDTLSMTADQRIILSEIEDRVMLKDAILAQSRSLLLAFGPEGGWKEEELTAFEMGGWRSASLGGTILRAETAVIAAVAIATSALHS
ncbi:MAG TPA: RsmE family RNA methyltransferase [Terriglobales bacterium]|nr:RsmE family RNA methyltransferase [Terriglobales bacterium]